MKTISINLMMIALTAFSFSANAQIKNAKTEIVTIYGNCGMCESNIESAGNLKKVANVDWDKDSKQATITYNSAKTNKDEILKRIALAGYDSDSFLAPDDVYNDLHGCCQYDRTAKVETVATEMHAAHKNHGESQQKMEGKQIVLQSVYDNYFALKDALVSSNSATAAAKATALSSAIEKIEMGKLDAKTHTVWMNVMNKIQSDSKSISSSKDLAVQRKHFTTLSKDMYSLMKTSNLTTEVYYQFCPMANDGKGANWLSKENEVRNPYYGSAMMSCGKTVETIK